jgi:signal transduction histidine kinase
MTQELDQNQAAIFQQAFKQFSLESSRVEWIFQNLEERFNKIQGSVQESHLKLAGKLKELEFITSYLKAILDNISQGIIFIDLNYNVTTYNASAQQILGIPENELLFHSFRDFFDDNFLGFSLKNAFESNLCPKNSLISWNRSDDKKFELEIEATLVVMKPQKMPIDYLKPPNSSIQGLLVLIRNVTEMHKLQMIVNRHDLLTELGEMAAHLAHEIRNPLGGIKGFATLLHQDLQNQSELQQMAAYIVEGTDNLNRLVTAILQYTRPFQPALEKIDLVPFIEEIKLFLLADPSWNPSITFTIISKFPLLQAWLDPNLFRSALLNLFVNAQQAMLNGGQLEVLLDHSDSDVVIQVKDSGAGIAEENLKKIFSPFFTTKTTGTGLGLAEVQKVVQAHQGTIEVSSKIGLGTCFTIKLPIKT